MAVVKSTGCASREPRIGSWNATEANESTMTAGDFRRSGTTVSRAGEVP